MELVLSIAGFVFDPAVVLVVWIWVVSFSLVWMVVAFVFCLHILRIVRKCMILDVFCKRNIFHLVISASGSVRVHIEIGVPSCMWYAIVGICVADIPNHASKCDRHFRLFPSDVHVLALRYALRL